MDVDRIPRECWKSFRIVYTDEWWLFPGVLVVAIAYPLWVGATGAAVTTIADFVGLSLALDPWTGRTTALAVVLGILWVVAPAAVATQLALNRLRNPHGNLRACYRLRHPLSLFLLPILLLGLGLAILAAAGSGSVPGQTLIVVGAVYLALRGTAYAYRVFALSLPLLAEAVLFLAVAGLAVVILAAGAIGAGRAAIVADAAAGVAGVVGVHAIATYLDGTVAAGPIRLSMLAATVVVSAVLPTAVYLFLQLSVSAIQRFRKPDVKRSSLRTGQRYPGFAHPTSGPSRGGGGGSSGSPSSSAGAATSAAGSGSSSGGGGATGGAADGNAAAGTGGDDRQPATADADDGGPGGGAHADEADEGADEKAAEIQGVRNTRVYSPPEDAEDITLADAEEIARRTASGKFCPNCDESYEDETRTFCTTCGSRLEQP